MQEQILCTQNNKKNKDFKRPSSSLPTIHGKLGYYEKALLRSRAYCILMLKIHGYSEKALENLWK
jgi:hypothetical protein